LSYQYDKSDNLAELFENAVEKYPNHPIFGTKNSKGVYDWVTYGDVGTRVTHLRGGLAHIGIGKDDTVGFIGNNRTEWAVTAFATYSLGGRYVPMYESELVKIWKYIISDSHAKVVFVSKPEIYEEIKNFKDEIPGLEKIFLIEGQGENTMEELEKIGEANPAPSVHPDPHDIAVLIYTSGTTGDPKGVLLTHGNFMSNLRAGGKLFPILDENSRVLSILPWAHSFGQTAEIYNLLQFGASFAFMENPRTIVEDMALVRPTFLIAVPRVFNKIYEAIHMKMNKEGGIAKFLFDMGVEAAKKKRELADEGKSCFLTELKFRIADKLVFSKIRDKLGGRLQGVLTASAAMNKDIAHFFFDVGIPLYDAYGMTETSPAVTMNSPMACKLGSVGRPIDRVKVVIDKSAVEEGTDDGEIIVYGPNVMKGYHNKPEATQEVMTEDGGVRTGDRGKLDEDGFLFITGRIKEQYKLENGKFVFPASLEEDIKLLPYVENAMIYGENRPYNVCLVVPSFEMLEEYVRKHSLPEDPEQLIQNEQLREFIGNEIVSTLKGNYGGYEIPRKFVFLSEDFTLENGMLTQTMKLKRRIVLEKYKSELEAQYNAPKV